MTSGVELETPLKPGADTEVWELRLYIAGETAKWKKVIEQSGVRVE